MTCGFWDWRTTNLQNFVLNGIKSRISSHGSIHFSKRFLYPDPLMMSRTDQMLFPGNSCSPQRRSCPNMLWLSLQGPPPRCSSIIVAKVPVFSHRITRIYGPGGKWCNWISSYILDCFYWDTPLYRIVDFVVAECVSEKEGCRMQWHNIFHISAWKWLSCISTLMTEERCLYSILESIAFPWFAFSSRWIYSRKPLFVQL